MLRAAILRSVRGGAGAGAVSRRQYPVARRASPSSFISSAPFVPAISCQAVRSYSAPSGLSQQEVQGRILDLVKNFDKVTDPTKLSGSSHFSNDLGLDSLDTVEVVMAIEEEFSIEIPDKEADSIQSIEKAVDYILAQPDADQCEEKEASVRAKNIRDSQMDWIVHRRCCMSLIGSSNPGFARSSSM
ncbi:MAG: hypothetical protein M1837_005559 [Sclerophora amabilis]|nr:MAG: hypothetical protein M1837_005559 [Sclerophora amabilis]